MNHNTAAKPEIEKEIRKLLHCKSDTVRERLKGSDNETVYSYLALLYKGNGWLTALHRKGEKAVALLLYNPRQPDTLQLIVKLIFSGAELSYLQAREELRDFENTIGPVYECSQYCLIAADGFEIKAQKLEHYNMLMQDWSYIDHLADHYSSEKMREPRIQLFAHNKLTYRKIQRAMQQSNAVAVIQATGTGKSYLIAKMLHDFTGQRRIVLAPSVYIINQLKEHIPWEKEKIVFLTYMRLSYMTDEEIRQLKPDMIVLDEYHRGGAEEWGRAVQQLLAEFPNAFRLGTTATPVRYMDNARDMSDELFEGNVAENLNLSQAIVRKILPMPKYVCALYTLDNEIRNLREKIVQSNKKAEVKNKLMLELDAFKINWEQSRGIPYVLKKHLGAKMNKFIIFCRDQEHLVEMEPQVIKWFKEAQDKKIISYRVFLNEDERDENLERFKVATDKDEVHLLFSINMLNEGLHVNEVSGVMLLRPTESPIIFYQQIGRCLKVGMNQRPVIFDMVNNFRSIRTGDFLRDLEFERSGYLKEREAEGLTDDITPRFTVIDEVMEITEVFGEIRFRVDNWMDMLEQLVEFKNEHGHFFVPEHEPEHTKLCNWMRNQRALFRAGKLDMDRIERLESIGFYWESIDERWNTGYQRLVDYKEKNGHCNVPLFGENDRALGYWLYKQRKVYADKQLQPERIDKLEKLGVDWKSESLNRDLEELWNTMYAELCLYKQMYGTANVSPTSKTHTRLGMWLGYQRSSRKAGRITQEKIDRLDLLGIDWDPKATKHAKWDITFEKLCSFKEKHGHADVKLNDSDRELAYWVRQQRDRYKHEKLPDTRIKRLNAIGFNWTVLDPENWNKNFEKLKLYYAKNGIVKKIDDTELSKWASRQRQEYKTSLLKAEYIQRLIAIGFDINPQSADERWELMYNHLLAFKQMNGHCNVSNKAKDGTGLGPWVSGQRGKKRRKMLSNERIKKLEQAGISWEPEQEEWNQRYNELKTYKERNGNTQVPENWKENKILSHWVATQRFNRRKKIIAADKKALLDALGFVWDPLADNWDKMFDRLYKFKQKNGHCFVSLSKIKEPDQQLALWLNSQRNNWNKGILLPHHREQLENLGVKSSANEMLWDIKFSELEKYKDEFGDCHVPYDTKTHRPLAQWLLKQRLLFKKGKLEENKILRLKNLGYLFDRGNWAAMYAELKKYKANYGSCNVSAVNKEYAQLGSWVAWNRADYHDKTIAPQRIQLLNEIGFEWERKSARDKEWMEQYENLRTFFNSQGHATVQPGIENKKLHNWSRQQRAAFKDGRMPAERQQLLEEINFEWVLKEDPEILFNERYAQLLEIKKKKGVADLSGNLVLQKWISNLKAYKEGGYLSNEKIIKMIEAGIDLSRGENALEKREKNFNALVDFKNKFGHCKVNAQHKGYVKLCQWVNNMRQVYRRGELDNEFIERLDALGFVWVYKEIEFEKLWMSMYDRLKQWVEKNGHCNITDKWTNKSKHGVTADKTGEDPELARWVLSQRRNFKDHKLSPERIALLQQLGFDFDFLKNEWDRRFAELEKFKKLNGHCKVSQNKEPWNRLAEWCSTQRWNYKDGKLANDRLQRLEAIGFVWDLEDHKWEMKYEELKKFLKTNNWSNLYANNRLLFNWVSSQRQNLKTGILKPDKKALLDELAIVWNVQDELWNTMYAQLIAYKNTYGDCLVTVKKEKALANWVYNQRESYKLKKLPSEKIKQLEKLGFVWKVTPRKRGQSKV